MPQFFRLGQGTANLLFEILKASLQLLYFLVLLRYSFRLLLFHGGFGRRYVLNFLLRVGKFVIELLDLGSVGLRQLVHLGLVVTG